jgi:bifunctional DNA-binding transcriptional regulator/antitoxin component of YhaV-PrlF toxin-antitoxin module
MSSGNADIRETFGIGDGDVLKFEGRHEIGRATSAVVSWRNSDCLYKSASFEIKSQYVFLIMNCA